MNPVLFTVEHALCTTAQTRAARSDIIVLMTTNMSDSDEARAELDERWAQWVAAGARRNRDKQKTVGRFAIAIAIALGVWVTTLLVRG